MLPGDGTVDDFNGSYSDWRRNKGELKKKTDTSGKKLVTEKASRVKETPKKLSYHEQREMQQLEDELDQLHSRREELMNSFSGGDSSELDMNEASKELKLVSDRIEDCEERWLALADKL